MTKEQALIEIMGSMSTADLVAVHNRYCDDCRHYDGYIFPMAEYEDQMQDVPVMTLTQMIVYGNFNPNDDYFWYNGNGNLESGDCPECGEHQQIFISDIANAMLRNESGFGNDECQDVIDEEEGDAE